MRQHPFAILPRLLAAALLFSGLHPASAQTAGTLKPGYNPANLPNDGSLVSTVQADGKIVVGSSTGLVRLNPDGSPDAGFNAPAGLGKILALAAGPNRKIMVLTDVPDSAYVDDFHLMRLQADGAVDPLFTPVTRHGYPNSHYFASLVLAVQPDEKVLLADNITDPDQSTAGILIARYNADGSLDAAFTGNANAFPGYGVVYDAVVPLESGKILVAGYGAVAYRFYYAQFGLIVLLNADGTVDKSYDGGSSAYAPTLLPDGEVVYLADLSQPFNDGSSVPFGGVPRRLNADFAADTSFAPTFATGASFSSLVVQSNGKLVVGGYTTSNTTTSDNGVPQVTGMSGVARLNADGSTDASFDPGTGANENSVVNSTYVTPDSSIVVVGNFSTFDGQPRNGIAALYGDGGLNEPFFNGEYTLSGGVYYLAFPNGNFFGFYSFLDDPHYLCHFDLGCEYVFEAADGQNGLYLYDFKSSSFFYTSASFPFPYLYDFSLNTVLYYYPDPNNADRYNTNGVRYFYDFATGKIIMK